ncbi:MAG TPA: bifunctional DNA primase/polymerase [Actinocrinis sp.]|uniref:bifunctional DNA primase/polymerase n=1 Tax=Actinocrinis sp. TaxID=1920516 RepID=UPI002DDDA1DB|nr:bifunctional DNA primase/polymerase [Actinocrinis sp.]HEV2344515.1 bifunctional DNA primase/polymerase [Actinocrinis sp.]
MTPATDTRTLTDTALDLAAHGMHVFPLKPGSKVPALMADWEGRATTDPARIQRCWSAGAFNIGIACGPSGLLVVDLDTPKPETKPPAAPFDQEGVNDGMDALAVVCIANAEPFPFDTLTVTTGRGGTHLYFTQPEGQALRNSAGRLGWLIDTRGVGGYVVAPGSTVDGNPYTLTFDTVPAVLPCWLARLLAAPKSPPRPARMAHTAARSSSGYGAAVLRGELAKLTSARAGTRNDTLNAVAFTLGTHVARGTLTRALAEAALTQVAERWGTDVSKSLGTIERSLSDGERKAGTR